MTTPRRPPGRYDEKRAIPRWVRLAGAAVLGLLLVGVAYLAYDRFAGGRVRFGTLGYSVLSDTAVEVRFEVRKSPDETVRCQLQARDKDGALVGSEQITVGPSDREAVLTAHELTTSRRAATGEVTACTLEPAPSP